LRIRHAELLVAKYELKSHCQANLYKDTTGGCVASRFSTPVIATRLQNSSPFQPGSSEDPHGIGATKVGQRSLDMGSPEYIENSLASFTNSVSAKD
jgi:hypothetical protein